MPISDVADWTPEQAKAFGDALSDLLDTRRVKRPALAEALDVSPELVRQWQTGQSEPPRTKVFAIEKHFRLRPGALSRTLGYLPLEARSVRSVVEAIDTDTALSEVAKAGLRDAYRAMAGH